MSVSQYIYEPNNQREELWQTYLLNCRAEGTKPSLKDFDVWYQEQDVDEDPVDWDEVI